MSATLEMTKGRRAVFLDRDGTLTREKGYLRDPEALELEADAAEAVRLLNRAGIPVVLVSNQSGIARGLYTEQDLLAVHDRLLQLLSHEDAWLDGSFYCPHHPEGILPDYTKHCACRKPGTDMLRQAHESLGIRVPGSYMIGDKRSDMEFARNGDLVGILVTTGYGGEQWRASLREPASHGPDLVAGTLLEAVQRVVSEVENNGTNAVVAGMPVIQPWTCKFASMEHLKRRIERHRARGERIVLANGVFDLLHVGHVGYLQASRRLGEVLVVAVNDDSSTNLLKGPGRPVFPVEDRIAILSALSCVDYCVVFGEPTVDTILESVRPDYHSKGTDYTEDSVPEGETTRRLGGRVRIVGPPKTGSTTELLRRISKMP